MIEADRSKYRASQIFLDGHMMKLFQRKLFVSSGLSVNGAESGTESAADDPMAVHESGEGGEPINRAPLELESSVKPEDADIQGPEVGWRKWYGAFKQILPTYIATHLAFFVSSCLAVLFLHPDFDWRSFPLYTLWQSWFRWDTGHFVHISLYGYTDAWRTAFFPLYPLLIKAVAPLTHNPFTAELLISNIALLVVSMVLYQLVCEDFDRERADRTVLYLSVFPTAFFLAVGYNESLFLCLALLCFYQMRHGRWWLAALFGLFASLTRSAGLFLALPFCLEYLRQHQFRWRLWRL